MYFTNGRICGRDCRPPQSVWMEKLRDFQRQWVMTVSDLARKHRDVMDRQYQAAVDSLEEALRMSESHNPEEFRQRAELVCRKTSGLHAGDLGDADERVSERDDEVERVAHQGWFLNGGTVDG